MTLYPDVMVEFSPSTNPLDEPVWEDITPYLRSFSYDRGRARSVNRAEAGTAEITLDNTAGRFDPGNEDGPYYPGVRPMRRIRITALIDEGFEAFTVGDSFVGDTDVIEGGALTTIPMFSGYVEKWRQVWNPAPSPRPDPTAVVSAVDAFKIFSLQQNGGTTGAVFLSGQLVDQMLDAMDWPADLRRIDTGKFAVQDPIMHGPSTRMAAFQSIDASEGGLFYIDGDGSVVFTSADHIFLNPPEPDEVWGDIGPAEHDYGDIVIDYDEQELQNDVTVTSPGQTDATASDPQSIERYLARDNTSLSTVLNYHLDMQTRAFDYVAQFSEPHREITEIEVGRRDDVDWKLLLRKRLQDRVVVRRRPAGEDMIEQDSVIEGIAVNSPHQLQTNVRWRVSASYGVNKLLPFQSSFEDGGTTGWQVLANCTLSNNVVPFETENVHGVHHMKITPIANGTASAETTPTTQLAVVVGQTYTLAAYFFVPSSPTANAHTEIAWRNSSGTFLSATTGDSVALPILGAAEYVQAYATGVAPANAAFATMRVVLTSTQAGDDYYVDAVGFLEGDRRVWSLGRGDIV